MTLPTSIYTEHLDLPFVVGLRRKREFWDTLELIERPQNDLTTALRNHVRVIAESFREYLINIKKHSVRTSRAKVIIRRTDAGFAGATLTALACAAAVQKLPWYGTAIVGGGVASAKAVQYVVEQLFASETVEDPHFTRFTAQLENAGKQLLDG